MEKTRALLFTDSFNFIDFVFPFFKPQIKTATSLKVAVKLWNNFLFDVKLGYFLEINKKYFTRVWGKRLTF
jgi:hypothetical protein